MDITSSFIFYGSFFEAITELDDAEQLALFRAICSYGLTGECAETTGVVKGMFSLIKPQMDANAKRRENAKKGGAPRDNSNAGKRKSAAKQPTVVSVDDKKQPTVVSVDDKKQPTVVFEAEEKQPNVNVNVNANVNENANVNVNENENENVITQNSGDDGGKERVREALRDAWGREPTETEYGGIRTLYLPLGGISEQNYELLEQAAESAAEAGACNLKYIRGCFKRYRERGITDNDSYWDYELRRDGITGGG